MANPAMEDGRLAGAVLVLLDVTEREDREQLRREFTANVSHELRTPADVHLRLCRAHPRRHRKAADVQHFAGNIYTEAQRLIALVGDIIRLSQLDEGSVGARRRTCASTAWPRASSPACRTRPRSTTSRSART